MTQTHDVSGRRAKKKYSSRKRTVQPTLVTGTSQGTKRKRDDELGSLPADRPSHKRPDAKGESLIEEIQALGGDATDLALVGDIESQSEQEGDQNNDPTLQADLELFAKGLSLSQSHSLGVTDSHDSELDLEVGLTGSETRPSIPGLKTIFPLQPDWYNAIPGANRGLSTPGTTGQYQGAITSLKSHSRSIWDQEAARYVSAVSSSSKHKFLSTITSTGTMSDKVSALTLAVQESPVHNAKALETLISMASKRNRGQVLVALSALVDLFGPGNLLPSDRRLRQFHLQPSLLRGLHEGQVRQWASPSRLPPGITEAHLLSWIFEDWLKEAYFRVLRILEGLCDDEVEHSRLKSLDFVFALLQEKPEQEANLLRLVIHKLGDPEKRIASRASYSLLQLMTSHPAMKEVIIKTVEEQIILRPSRNSRAMYYAITTLNQTILNTKDFHIADILHDVYFASFVSILKTQQTQHKKEAHGSQTSDPGPSDNDTSTVEKLISAILTGVNRAAPFCSLGNLSIDSHIDTLFRVAHSSNFNTSIQALILIQQLSQMNGLARDRFYKTLYESLLDPRLINSSKQTLYLNLMFRSLKSDVSLARVKAFVKRMIQVASLHQPPFICGIIYLVTELSRFFPALSVLFEEPEVDGPGGSGDADASTACSASAHEPGPLVYDGRKRDPEYSNADQSCLWEVIPFNSHFHPSVALFAASLVSRPDAIQKPELASHTLIHFLDRFVFRKARLKDSSRGVSIMQPTTVVPGSGNLFTSQKGSRAQEVDINSASFWQMKPADVPVEDAFFHEYFSLAGKQTPGIRAQINTLAGTSDEDDASDIWNALASSHPELEGAEEDDYPSDLDDIRFSDSDDDIVDLEDMSSSNDDDVAGGSACDDDSDAGSEPVPAEPTAELNVNTTMASTNLRRRKTLKNLPMFAPIDDYADILAMEEVLDNGV